MMQFYCDSPSPDHGGSHCPCAYKGKDLTNCDGLNATLEETCNEYSCPGKQLKLYFSFALLQQYKLLYVPDLEYLLTASDTTLTTTKTFTSISTSASILTPPTDKTSSKCMKILWHISFNFYDIYTTHIR